MLVDYDPIVNNLNWQWSAGSGAFGQPYFRVLNPWIQGKKFDREAKYIKKWIPELENVSAKHLHQWDKFHKHYANVVKYPAPMVNHEKARDAALKMYKDGLK